MSGRVPKEGGHVGSTSHRGVFFVIDIQPATRTATIKSLGVDGALVAGVRWTILAFDKQGNSRVIPDST
jgi:hypothetical protein